MRTLIAVLCLSIAMSAQQSLPDTPQVVGDPPNCKSAMKKTGKHLWECPDPQYVYDTSPIKKPHDTRNRVLWIVGGVVVVGGLTYIFGHEHHCASSYDGKPYFGTPPCPVPDAK